MSRGSSESSRSGRVVICLSGRLFRMGKWRARLSTCCLPAIGRTWAPRPASSGRRGRHLASIARALTSVIGTLPLGSRVFPPGLAAPGDIRLPREGCRLRRRLSMKCPPGRPTSSRARGLTSGSWPSRALGTSVPSRRSSSAIGVSSVRTLGGSTRAAAHLRGWLYQIVRNTAIRVSARERPAAELDGSLAVTESLEDAPIRTAEPTASAIRRRGGSDRSRTVSSTTGSGDDGSRGGFGDLLPNRASSMM
jgi:hypothetical protein